MNHKAFLSRIFGVHSGKPPSFTIAGKRVITPNDTLDNLRERMHVPYDPTPNRRNQDSINRVNTTTQVLNSNPTPLSNNNNNSTPISSSHKKYSPSRPLHINSPVINSNSNNNNSISRSNQTHITQFIKQETKSPNINNKNDEENDFANHDDIIEFTPTPKKRKNNLNSQFKRAEKKRKISHSPNKSKNNQKKSKLSSDDDDESDAFSPDAVDVFLTPSTQKSELPPSSNCINLLSDSQNITASDLLSLENTYLINQENSNSYSSTPLSMDIRCLNTQLSRSTQTTSQKSLKQNLSNSPNYDDDYDELDQLSLSLSRSTNEPSKSSISIEIPNSFDSNSSKSQSSQFPSASLDPFTLASGLSSSNSVKKKLSNDSQNANISLERNSDPRLTQLARENYVLKQKLLQLETTAKQYHERLQTLTKLFRENCPDVSIPEFSPKNLGNT